MSGVPTGQSIRVQSRASGREWTFEAGSDRRLCRSENADVPLQAATISRVRHAVLRFESPVWVLADDGGNRGIYVNGVRSQRVEIRGRSVVRLGTPEEGDDLVFEPLGEPVAATLGAESAGAAAGQDRGAAQSPMDAATRLPAGTPSGSDDTTRHGGAGARPGSLRVAAEGQAAQTFPPDQPVTVGRGRDSDIRVDRESMSRQHGVLRPQPDGSWLYTDRSSEGSWRDGRKVTSLRVDGDLELVLGDRLDGARVRFEVVGRTGKDTARGAAGSGPVPPPRAPKAAAPPGARAPRPPTAPGPRGPRPTPAPGPRGPVGGPPPVPAARAGGPAPSGGRKRRRVKVAVVGGVLLVAIAVGAVLALEPFGPARNDHASGSTLAAAKRATVKLKMFRDQGEELGSGSGVIVSADGTILTNAHVAKPSADGQGYNYGYPAPLNGRVDYLLVGVVGARDDAPVTYSYRARVVAVDGYLDLAVIKIAAGADGAALTGPVTLPFASVKDSTSLRTGDAVTVLGFPGAVGSESLTVTQGTVSTFAPDQRLSSDRGWVDTDSRVTPGNSGGPVIDSRGQVVGLATRGRQDQGSNQFRPSELALPLLDRARAGNPADTGAAHLPDIAGISATPTGLLPAQTAQQTPCGSGYDGIAENNGPVVANFLVRDLPAGGELYMVVRDVTMGVIQPAQPGLSAPVYEAAWGATPENPQCAQFLLHTEVFNPGVYYAELWTDPAGSGPRSTFPFRVGAAG